MKILLLAAACACIAYSQDSSMNARELFYGPTPDAQPKKPAPRKPAPTVPTTTVANVPLGLRYSVLRRDSADKFAEVDADSTFRSGDRIRLNVDSNTSGYLYVVAQGSSGNWHLLFPSADIQGGNNRIDKGVSQQIPPGAKGQFMFDDQSGTEKLFLVLTRQPEPDLDKLIYSINGAKNSPDRTLMAGARVGDDVVNRLRDQIKSRDLLFEKVDEIKEQPTGQVQNEKATYVVNPSRSEDARLVVDVALKHNK